jgi:hypothetical protein
MNGWREQLDRLNRVGYLQQFSNMAMSMCVPFWWSSGPRDGAIVRQNGTLCYVNTGTKRIGITANHVYAGYLADIQGHEEVECQFGGSTVNPEERLISRSERYDLATFDIPEVFVSASFRHVCYHDALQWPPPQLAAGQVALHGGYPQVLRNPRTNEVDCPFQWFVTQANDANQERISLDPDIPHMHWPGHEGEQINDQFHGQSGGPVYRVIDANPAAGEVVDRLKFVGIIYNRLMDLVLARPSALINADGTIVD